MPERWERRDRDDLLAVMQSGEPYTTKELASELDWPPRTVHHILDELADEGTLRKKKTGHRSVIWMLQDDP